jgi:beta-galactosidase
MKPLFSILLFSLILWSCSSLEKQDVSEILFDYDWRFALNDQVGAELPGYNDSHWRQLDLPHDFSIEQPFDSLNPSGQSGAYAFGGVGWYRKRFTIPLSDEDKRVSIRFNGVYRNSEVWINGHLMGKRPYGYSTFIYDLTSYLNKPGTENVIAVKVNTTDQPNSRWYTGSGIYRHVWLKTSGKTYFTNGGIFITTPKIADDKATIRVSCEVTNEGKLEKPAELKISIRNRAGKVV